MLQGTHIIGFPHLPYRLSRLSGILMHWLFVLCIAVILLSACDSGNKKETKDKAISMLNQTSKQKDYKRMLALADSLGQAEVLNEGESYYWQGLAYYHMMQVRTAEFCWKKAISAVDMSEDETDLATYARSASYMTSLHIRYLNFASALKVAKTALDHLDLHHHTSSSDYTNLLIFEGCCQAHFNSQDPMVNTIFERAYQRHIDNISQDHAKTSYRDAVVGIINIAYGWLGEKQYEKGLLWIDRLGKIVAEYRQYYADDEAYIDKQWARYQIFMAVGMEGIGQKKKAADAFATYQQTHFAHTPEGKLDASDYLEMTGNWNEAAHNLDYLDEFLAINQAGSSLEDIQRYLLKKYQVNIMAQHIDSANAVANKICERLDSAIIKSQWADAEEQETIRQKEEQIMEQQQHMSRTRIAVLIGAIIVLSIFFSVFNILRHRADKRLAEVRAAKERMESELNIARDIQMSMVPNDFPDYPCLDMFASMTPAREVGGDLYSFLLKDDTLYFCVGDVSGKGVPASLFMAQATRLFHSMAESNTSPAQICTSMNSELSGEDNQQGMFVTMFVGRLDLKQHMLEFCNAGHNPPVLSNTDGQFTFLEMEPNAPIGLWPGLEYVGQQLSLCKGQLMLLYTDGLNEAEDPQQAQFGEDRIVELLASLSSKNCQDIIETLKTNVTSFRDGAEPNDDLTMLCMKLS